MLIKGVSETCPVIKREVSPGHHNNVQSAQCMLMQAKTFPDKPLNKVSVNGASDVLFRDRQPQSWFFEITRPEQNGKKLIYRLFGAIEYPAELSRLQ